MKGTYKVYDHEQGEWKELPLFFKDPIYLSCSYMQLLSYRNSSELIPGAFYRITDYECTTTQKDTQSANHPFDIIVQALDEKTLSENASAIQREGDEYFANSNLNAWKLKYAIDNDTSRFAWAQEEIKELPAKWEGSWGVLEERYASGASTNRELWTIDDEQVYLYRPAQPTSYLNGKKFYRNVVVGSITSTEGFIYEADNAPENYGDSENEDWYWDDVYKIRVKTSDGQLVATLSTYGCGEFVDYEYDENGNYHISFSPNAEWDGENEVYRYTPISGVEDWFEFARGGVINEYSREYYNGSVNSLYYACPSILGQWTTQIMVITDKVHLYEYEGEIIDTITYEACVESQKSGKGVIYRLIDEHNNDCPFDFKNIQFKRDNEWYYTFSQNGRDLSLTDYCVENFILQHTDQAFSDGTTAVKTIIPMVVFDIKSNSSGKFAGILHNKIQVPITKGYLAGSKIAANEWYDVVGGKDTVVSNMRIVSLGVIYGNRIYGPCANFEVGTTTPVNAFYTNNIALPSYQMGFFKCLCSVFNNNTLNLSEGKRSFTITSGSLISCEIENSNYVRTSNDGVSSDDISLGADVVLRNSRIRIFNDLIINYANTTSSTSPLRFLDIDARGWEATTITIPTSFPTNANYELKVAKNSQGVIKMWCDADLIQ